MNMTFKSSPFKEWTLTDDSIILGNKTYPLTSISNAKHEPGTYCGYLFVKFEGKLMKTTLAYDNEQKEDFEKAKAYIYAVIRGDDPKKAMEKQENITKHGYRKICSVCGHIFCYTQEDIENNRQLIKRANQSLNVGLVDALAGNGNSFSTEKQTAEDLMNRVIDYSKCPKCGSKELRDATEDDIAKSKEPQGTVIQQASAADELKKFKDLLDMGVIAQDEFDAKKKQLLGL